MTIIVCDADAGIMLADTYVGCEDGFSYPVDKIFRTQDGSLVGAAGSSNPCLEFIRWAIAGCEGDPPKKYIRSNVEGLLLTPDRAIVYYNGKYPERLLSRRFAIGAGSRECMAALAAGASLERSVEIACELQRASCAPPITRLELGADQAPRAKGKRRVQQTD